MIVMELLTKEKFALLNTADDTTCWRVEDIKVCCPCDRQLVVLVSMGSYGHTTWSYMLKQPSL